MFFWFPWMWMSDGLTKYLFDTFYTCIWYLHITKRRLRRVISFFFLSFISLWNTKDVVTCLCHKLFRSDCDQISCWKPQSGSGSTKNCTSFDDTFFSYLWFFFCFFAIVLPPHYCTSTATGWAKFLKNQQRSWKHVSGFDIRNAKTSK